MYVIKHVPEDFVVEEVSTVKSESSGSFVYFKLWKKDVSTLDALHYLSHDLRAELSCAGNKDKRAITEQVCSARTTKDRLERLSYQNMRLSFLGYGDEPVHLGDLKGNKFKIVVRNIEILPKIQPKFRNLFGEQRDRKSVV